MDHKDLQVKYQEKLREVIRESNREDDRIYEKLKREGRYIMGLDSNTHQPEFVENKRKTMEKIKQLQAEYEKEMLSRYTEIIAYKETLDGAQGNPGEIIFYEIEDGKLKRNRVSNQEGFYIPKFVKEGPDWERVGLCSRHNLYIPSRLFDEFSEMGRCNMKNYEDMLKKLYQIE